jgi:predicted metal-binding membrane protein
MTNVDARRGRVGAASPGREASPTASGWAASPAIVVAATLGLAGACWAVSVWLMRGMDMGLATRPGSFGFFAAVWVTMMAAMMLPGAAPAVAHRARVRGTVRSAVPFVAAYLAIWAAAGLIAYVVDRPHGPLVAGAVVIAAGAYELTPVKRHFRRRCLEAGSRPSVVGSGMAGSGMAESGVGFGMCCIGSTVGLMAMLVALGVMSLLWMAVVAVLAFAQKLLPAKAAIDVPLALALIGFGLVIAIEPSLIPGLMPAPM